VNGFVSLVSEKIVDVFDLKAEDINIWDIAWALSQTNRYNGCTPVPWDVLSHTGMVYALYNYDHRDNPLPSVQMAILLHDAAEAYVGDVVQPLRNLDQMAWFNELEDQIKETIFERFGLSYNDVDWATVKHYDGMAYSIEIEYMKPTSKTDEHFSHTPISFKMPLGKALPQEYVSLLHNMTVHFNVVNPEPLFAMPEILKPYVIFPKVEVEDTGNIPPPRSSKDVDGMRL
jgi:uncharacterized protein